MGAAQTLIPRALAGSNAAGDCSDLYPPNLECQIYEYVEVYIKYTIRHHSPHINDAHDQLQLLGATFCCRSSEYGHVSDL